MKINSLIFGLFVTAFVIVGIQTDGHAATDPHWTDGSTYQGSHNYEAPPAIETDDECNIWMLDPPAPTVYIYLTVHYFENDIEFASEVVPYEGPLGGSFPHNVHAIVDNHEGTAYLTWNIGTGHSPLFHFNCLQTVPSTVSSTTPSTVKSTTTSLQTSSTSSSSMISTTTSSTPTGSTPHSGTSSNGPTGTDEPLPNTGANNAQVALAGIVLGTAGAGLASVRKRRRV